ncbi:M15 family peptidase [Duganella sp. FT92W]|uniref:M15 family peptidase n=1 Tax=Pseudoduganella rivuli TaxID=2666085 RepID=A0A7X2IT34_9BURK|nr:M15 family metallopeptidase [Pseudoduganella rivuli]MRV75591.1 M15 family peptidase [Pseudoduganella rivuli]
MVLYSLLLFLCAGMAGALLAFPAARDILALAVRAIGMRLHARHAAAAVASVTLLGGLPLAAWLVSDAGGDESPGEQAYHPVNLQVAQLLDGEHLAPPQPLPPLAFTTAEVTLVRPMLAGASRDWALLDDGFSQRLLQVFRIMREQHGYDMALLEGYRSPQRQDQLAAAGPHVTSARAYQSYHQFGQAADCAFVRSGKLVISERDPWAMRGYRLYGETAEAVGLKWGGRWAMMDFGHVELRAIGN